VEVLQRHLGEKLGEGGVGLGGVGHAVPRNQSSPPSGRWKAGLWRCSQDVRSGTDL
jgi:hypothetical protein